MAITEKTSGFLSAVRGYQQKYMVSTRIRSIKTVIMNLKTLLTCWLSKRVNKDLVTPEISLGRCPTIWAFKL